MCLDLHEMLLSDSVPAFHDDDDDDDEDDELMLNVLRCQLTY